MSGHFTTSWRYRPRLRPAYGGGVPSGVRWDYVEAPDEHIAVRRPDLPVSRHRYGVICTERELTAEECTHFDLVAVA
jgi:hypothetical protein